jgi:hypothetical protein
MLVALGLCLVMMTRSGAAQTPSEPRLMFSIFGGVSIPGSLFRIPVQPFSVPCETGACVPFIDTLALSRTMASAATAGLNGTLYGSSHFGLTAEIVYIGFGVDDTCDLLFEHPDFEQRNRQLCEDISQKTATKSTVGITFGGAARLSPQHPVSPYIRLQGGIGIRSSSIVEMSGRYQSGGQLRDRPVILDDRTTSVHPMFVGALGVMFSLGSGYQLRAELRDNLMLLERPTGPANELARVNKESFWSHVPAIVFGFDIVLQKKRGRRY